MVLPFPALPCSVVRDGGPEIRSCWIPKTKTAATQVARGRIVY
jgi:hypothetical protein